MLRIFFEQIISALVDSLGVYGLNTEEAKKRTIWESKGYRDRRPPSMTYDQAYGH